MYSLLITLLIFFQVGYAANPASTSTHYSATIPSLNAQLKNCTVFDLSQTHYKDPLLVNTANNVEAKRQLAQAAHQDDTMSFDLTALCSNDLVSQGAEPLFFNEHDLRGFAVGIVEREELLPKKDLITQSDVIIGLPSTSIHSSGYTLIQKIIKENNFDSNAKPPYATHHKTFGESLLEPSITYSDYVLPLCKENLIKAAVHINKDGLLDSIAHIVPETLSAQLTLENWHIPPIFRWLKHVAKLSDDQMAQIFNCGIGMALIADKKHTDTILQKLATQNIHAHVIGTIGTLKKGARVTIKGSAPTHAMKVLVVGSGSREHALAWKLAQSPYVGLVLVAPGNGGTTKEEKVRNIPINPQHTNALLTYVKQQEVDLVIVGPEAPIAAGFTDECIKKGLRCFAPTKAAAKIETSKVFAKQFMERHGIPTANYQTFTNLTSAQEFIEQQPLPVVIKTDGFIDGEEIIVAHSHTDAISIAETMLNAQPNNKIIIEQFLEGQKISFIVMADGEHILPLETSQNHKNRNVGECGPNTAGMGAYSPAPMITQELNDQIMETIIKPTIRGMKTEGNPFTGFLYASIIIQEDKPYVLEFYGHLGNPETEPLLMRLKSDLFVLCNAAMDHQLDNVSIEWDPRPALSVVITDGNYPCDCPTGNVIVGLPNSNSKEAKVFHDDTAYDNGKLITNGGRVLCAAALGEDLQEARNNAYDLIKNVYWPNAYYRNDIGYRALR